MRWLILFALIFTPCQGKSVYNRSKVSGRDYVKPKDWHWGSYWHWNQGSFKINWEEWHSFFPNKNVLGVWYSSLPKQNISVIPASTTYKPYDYFELRKMERERARKRKLREHQRRLEAARRERRQRILSRLTTISPVRRNSALSMCVNPLLLQLWWIYAWKMTQL